MNIKLIDRIISVGFLICGAIAILRDMLIEGLLLLILARLWMMGDADDKEGK